MSPTLPKNHQPLSVGLPGSLRKLLEEHCQRSGESAEHVIHSALSAYLGHERHTIFQVSTSAALVEGVYDGCVTVGELHRHGDFGLGTFFENRLTETLGKKCMVKARALKGE